jgi:pyruvate/2-oxoglutarate dehydrogenase complex dihydrolipoamide dehydrogenase (E3) component
MPKKALYNAARYRRAIVRAEQFGLEPCDAGFDWPAVLAWKWHAQETYAGDQEAILAGHGATLVRGTARFISPDIVEVDGTRFEPDHIVLATGSEPFAPPIPGIGLADTSNDALGYPVLPDSLLIIGGGFIALEFAAVFATFGVRLTIVSSGPRPLEMLDPDIAAVAVSRLQALGVEFWSDCRMTGISGDPGSLKVAFTDADGATHESIHERVLAAIGRRPAIADLDLEAAGVEVDGRGHIVVDRFLRTTNPRVWVAGDAAGGMMQTPVAAYEGRTVAESIDTGQPVEPDCRAVPTTVFTTPQLAQVGMSEQSAAEAGLKVRIARTDFSYLAAAVVEDERDGLIKLLFSEEDNHLVGAHIAGPTASDLIYALALGIELGATDVDLKRTLGVHPSYNEIINHAAW